MNSLPKKDNLLAYVSEQEVPVPPKPSFFKPKSHNNELSTAAFVAAISSIILGILIFPSLLGLTLGTGALIIAIKRGLPKKTPIISIIISAVTLILSTVGLIWVIFTATPESPPYIPPAYTHDTHSGIAYRYNPVSIIPCDSSGNCTFEVKLFQIDSKMCQNGGTFMPEMEDIGTKSKISAEAYDFPALKNGEEHALSITLKGFPNSRLIVAGSSYPISCK